MQPQHVYDLVAGSGIMAGTRGNFPPSVALPAAEVLFDEGIHAFEMTLNSVQPIEAMKAIKKHFGDKAAVGMGTVLTVADAERVIGEGADFIVSPAFQPDIVELALKHNVFIAPGVVTPTEAVLAWQMGVPLLKIFPIGSLGIEYFKAIFGPLNHMKFMCNGGMHDQNAAEFIQAGAVAAGMAGWLTGDGTWTESRLRSRAQLVRNAIEAVRAKSN